MTLCETTISDPTRRRSVQFISLLMIESNTIKLMLLSAIGSVRTQTPSWQSCPASGMLIPRKLDGTRNVD